MALSRFFFFFLQSTFFNCMGLILKPQVHPPDYGCAGGRRWALRASGSPDGLELPGLVGSCRREAGRRGQTPRWGAGLMQTRYPLGLT